MNLVMGYDEQRMRKSLTVTGLLDSYFLGLCFFGGELWLKS